MLKLILKQTLLLSLALLISAAPCGAKVKIIYDDDAGADPDGSAGFAMLNHLADLGECEIVAVTAYHTNIWSPRILEAGLDYYGRSSVPVGQNKTASDQSCGFGTCDWYGSEEASYFGVSTASYTDATVVLRTALAAASDNSITYVCMGPLRNLYELYNSPADGISGLTGAQLISAKVKEFVIMAGDFPTGSGEYNAVTGYTYNSSVAAGLASLGVKVTWIGFTLGHSVTYDVSSAAVTSYAYRCTHNVFPTNQNQSYDPISQLYAVRGLSHGATTYFTESSEGKCVISNTDGSTSWTSGSYNQHYLSLNISESSMATILNGLINYAPISISSIAVTPSSPSINAGSTQQFTATGTYDDSSTADLTSSVTWASASTGVATIGESTGLATGVSAGQSVISATLGEISGDTTLTVNAVAAPSITGGYSGTASWSN